MDKQNAFPWETRVDVASGLGEVKLIVPKPGQVVTGISLESEMLAAPTHWNGSNTILCRGANCACKKTDVPTQWYGHMLCELESPYTGVHIVRFGAIGCGMVTRFRDTGRDLLGVLVRFHRKGGAYNSPLHVDFSKNDPIDVRPFKWAMSWMLEKIYSPRRATRRESA